MISGNHIHICDKCKLEFLCPRVSHCLDDLLAKYCPDCAYENWERVKNEGEPECLNDM